MAAAGLVKGKKLTCYEQVKLDAENVGATWVRANCVRDGRLLTSPTWREHPAFYREAFGALNEQTPS
jgi:protease I